MGAKRKTPAKQTKAAGPLLPAAYDDLVGDIAGVLEASRRTAARAINAVMTKTYWEIGRRIVEFEQGGNKRASYGEALLARLSKDLTSRYGRGFGPANLSQMKKFYLLWAPELIFQTPSEESASPAASALDPIASRLELPWSAYVRLSAVKNAHARSFYETEAMRAGWSVRQLDRQIQSQFYERTVLSKNRAAMLKQGARLQPGDAIRPEEEIKDPYVLEFLGLRDEYSESHLEEALIRHLEGFLLELGGDFCFIGRQRRLRIGDEWYRVDLLFFHRRLRCLVLIDLKLGRFTHAHAGQMHTYLSYAAEHWTRSGENPPVGLLLCAQKDEALARYALDNLPNKVLAAEYRTVLPDEKLIAADLQKTRRILDRRSTSRRKKQPKTRENETQLYGDH